MPDVIDTTGMPDLTPYSPRVATLLALTHLCRTVRGSRYYVQRGPINWSAFDFDRFRWGIAILTPEFQVRPSNRGLTQTTVTLELVQKMPEQVLDPGERLLGLDDTGLESLVIDAGLIVQQLLLVKYPNGDQVVTRLVQTEAEGGVSGQELSSDDWSIQGIMVTFTVDH